MTSAATARLFTFLEAKIGLLVTPASGESWPSTPNMNYSTSPMQKPRYQNVDVLSSNRYSATFENICLSKLTFRKRRRAVLLVLS